MLSRILVALSLLFTLATWAAAQPSAQPKGDLPKVVLIGDSIRMGYAPLVAKRLAGKAIIISAKANGGDSANVLKNLEAWAIQEQPAVIHFNCGLHDLKLDRQKKTYQVDLNHYEKNLNDIVLRLQKETTANLVFATTTPIHDERHAKRGGFDRVESDVRRYNNIAVALMKHLRVVVHDLHWLVTKNDPAKLLTADGTHYTKEANELLADAVADVIQRQLTIHATQKPAVKTPTNPKVGEEYRKKEKELNALVPPTFKKLPIGTFHFPKSAAVWKQQRPDVLKKVVESLGDLPPRPSPQKVRIVSRELRNGYTVERIAIDNGVDGVVSCLLLVPEGLQKPAPAILWLHSSTPDKTQILVANTNGGAEPLGETFIKAGYVVLSPDAYWHGDRVGTGPAGQAETGRTEQESLLKYNLWMGRTLWGMFVRDDQIALDYLCSRPEVDAKRIGATGMSMGSTRAWWLAAVDERIACTVGVACLTRYENLIKHGQLKAHGVYYFVNGLLRHFDVEGVLALIAPRPYLALTGDLDAGSPADGIRVIEEKLSGVYRVLGVPERFENVLYPDVGHVYTAQMRSQMLAWFERWLKKKS